MSLFLHFRSYVGYEIALGHGGLDDHGISVVPPGSRVAFSFFSLRFETKLFTDFKYLRGRRVLDREFDGHSPPVASLLALIKVGWP